MWRVHVLAGSLALLACSPREPAADNSRQVPCFAAPPGAAAGERVVHAAEGRLWLPSVVPTEDGVSLFGSSAGTGGGRALVRATSADGLGFGPAEMAAGTEAWGEPRVARGPDGYLAHFDGGGGHRLGVATSPDGIVWSEPRFADRVPTGRWDSFQASTPFVAVDAGGVELWWTGSEISYVEDMETFGESVVRASSPDGRVISNASAIMPWRRCLDGSTDNWELNDIVRGTCGCELRSRWIVVTGWSCEMEQESTWLVRVAADGSTDRLAELELPPGSFPVASFAEDGALWLYEERSIGQPTQITLRRLDVPVLVGACRRSPL